MQEENKELLLKDLCSRLPYGVMCNIGLLFPLQLQRIFVDRLDGILLDFYEDGDDYQAYLSEVKPYLRPMSSMTEEEHLQLVSLDGITTTFSLGDKFSVIKPSIFDWLNAHHFDYRNLIELGLAIDCTKENNPYENFAQSNK